MSDIISQIKDWMPIVKEWHLMQHITALKNYYIHPRKFWNEYSGLTSKDKTIQFLLYLGIYTFLSLSLLEIPQENAVKLITVQASGLLTIVVVLYLGYLISHDEHHIPFTHFLIFSCYVIFLMSPLWMILYVSYAETGSYTILLIMSIVYALIDFYLWFAAPIIFIRNWKTCTLTILSTFAALNIVEVAVYALQGNNGTSYPNYIREERAKLGRSIHYPYVIPYCVVSNKDCTDSFYLFTDPTDSLATRIDSKQYFDKLKIEIDTLPQIIDRCKYKRNQLFFSKLLHIRKGILYCHSKGHYSNKILKEIVLATIDDKKEFDRYTYREFNEELTKLNDDVLKMDLDDARAYNIALLPLQLPILIRPGLILANRNN